MTDIVRPDAVPTGAKPDGGAEATESTGEGKSFDDVMNGIDGSKINVHSAEATVPSLQTGNDTRVQELTLEKTQVAESPGGIERLGQEIEANSVRLRELITELQSGKTFSTQELIGMQAEMHEITVQIEVTTKVVAETVSGARHLAQQQG